MAKKGKSNKDLIQAKTNKRGEKHLNIRAILPGTIRSAYGKQGGRAVP